MAKQDLHFSITATNEDLKRKLAESRQAILDSGKTAEAQASRIDGSFKRMAESAAIGFAAISFGKSVIRVRGEMQMMEQSFDVLLGSKSKATQMIAQIKQLAIDSPLEMPQVSGAAQILLGFGVEAEKVMGIVGQLSDVAMGDADRFRSLALVYAQTQAAGKLMGQDLLQMINAGFNPLQVMAEKTGKNIGQLKKEMESGAISAEMVADAFTTVTSEGGKFYQMTQKQASGIVGLQATFEDAITNQLNEFGKKTEGIIAGGYKMATSVVENADTIVKALVPIIATYGAYKASIIAVHAIGKVKESSFAAVEIAELSKLLPLKAQEANADIAAAVAKGHLSQATAERLVAIRAEVQAELEGLKVKAQTLAVQAAEAAELDKLALKKALYAERVERKAQQELSSAKLKWNYEKIRRGEIKLAFAEENLNIALKDKEATGNNLVTSSLRAKSAQTAVDTMQNNINAAASVGAAKAKTLWTAATMRLTKAFHSLKLAFASNPIGMILTGVTMAISLFTMFGKSTEDASNSIGGLTLKLSEEKSTYGDLKKAVEQSTEGTKERAAVIKLINERYPEYLSSMLTEKNSTQDIISALTTANGKMVENIKLKLKTTQLEGILNKQLDKEAGFVNSQVDYFKDSGNKAPEQIALFTNKMTAFVEKAREGKVTINDAREALIAFGEESEESVKEAIISSDGRIAKKIATLFQWSRDIRNAAIEAGNSQQILEELLKTAGSGAGTGDNGGNTSSASTKEQKDYRDAAEQALLSLEQMKIELLQAGREKELAQIEQTKKEKLAAIDKEQKEVADLLRKGGLPKEQQAHLSQKSASLEAQKPLVAQQATNDTTAVNKKYDDEITEDWKALTAVFLSEEEKRTGAIKDRYDKERERADKLFAAVPLIGSAIKIQIDAAEAQEQLDALIADYQTYADQRKAIEDKFNADLAALQAKNKDGKLDGNIKEVEKQKKVAHSKVNMAEASDGVDFTKLFGNLDNLTLPAAKELRNKIKVWIDEAGNSLAPEDLKAVSDAFQKLELKIADQDPFAILKSSITDYKKATEDVATAQAGVITSQEAYNKALADNGKDSEAAKKAAENLTEAEKNLSEAQQKRAAAVAKANEAVQSIADKGQQIIGAAQDVLGIMSDLGVQVPENISNALGGIGKIMDGLGSIDFAQPTSIVTGAVKMLGGVVKTITSLFGGSKKTMEELERLQKEASEKRYFAELEVNQLYRDRYEWAQKIGESTLQYIKRQGEELAKQGTDSDKDERALMEKLMNTEYKSGEHFEKTGLFGWGPGRIVEEYASLAGKSWKEIELLASSGALSEEGMKYYEAIKKAKEEGVDLAQKQTEYLERTKELTTGSTYDSVVSGIVDGFKAGKRSAADFSDSFGSLMSGAIESALSLLANEKARGWYDRFAELGEGGYTEYEIDTLKSDWIALNEQLAEDAKNLETVTGAKIGSEGNEVKNENTFTGAIRGSVATEASVAELGGLFRSQTDSLLRIDSKLGSGMASLLELARTNAAIELNTRATAANTAQTVSTLVTGFQELKSELTAINKNTTSELTAIKKNTASDAGSYGN